MTATAKPPRLLQQLKDIDVFEGIDPAALEWLAERGRYVEVAAGQVLFGYDEPVEYMQIMLEGSILLRRNDDEGRKREMGMWEAPYVLGILPFSRLKRTSAEGVVLEDVRILQIHKRQFTEMANVSYDLVERLVGVMTDRVRDFQNIQLMDEKLLALGKMSAGLAHELNNPASAMVRSSQELHRHLRMIPDRFKALVTMRTDAGNVDAINKVIFERIAHPIDVDELSLLEREERTDDLLDWFEARGIDDGDEVVDTFVDWGFTPAHLDEIATHTPEGSIRTVLWWTETNLTTEGLVGEIQTASSRIADLVSSIKTYSHMDSEPSMEQVDIHEGLKSTLTMLRYKFKQKNVQLDKTCNHGLPRIKALEGELNQVWTNLIVNALDALPDDGTGKITIRSYQRRDNLCVDVEDNGPGVPEDIQSRVFEPFFTTKGVGEGTGMGLDIVRRSLKRHGGTVSLDSEPGKTCFRVCFPL